MLSLFTDIFLQPVGISETEYLPMNLVSHYRHEITGLDVENIWVAGPYSVYEEKICAYKYRSHREYAREFADIYHSMIERAGYKREDCVLVFPPMHISRYFLRGFDHMGKIGHILEKEYGYTRIFPFGVKFSFRQAKLSKSHRREASLVRYFLKEREIPKKTILFIDDIISSGYTLFSLSKLLREHSHFPISAFFIASNSYPCQNISRS